MIIKNYENLTECFKELKNFYICEIYTDIGTYFIRPVLNRIGVLSKFEVTIIYLDRNKPSKMETIKSKKKLQSIIEGKEIQIKTVLFSQ